MRGEAGMCILRGVRGAVVDEVFTIIPVIVANDRKGFRSKDVAYTQESEKLMPLTPYVSFVISRITKRRCPNTFVGALILSGTE